MSTTSPDMVQRLRRLCCATVLLLHTAVGGADTSSSPQRDECGLKAAFLHNLASFVEWPAAAFAGPESPFILGVVGEDPFGPVLEQVVGDGYVGRRRIVTRRFQRGDEIGQCHLLFVAASEQGALSRILRRVHGHPVLTVSELPGFLGSGGMVCLARRDEQVVLVVNERAMHQAGLKASSKLLEIARPEAPRGGP